MTTRMSAAFGLAVIGFLSTGSGFGQGTPRTVTPQVRPQQPAATPQQPAPVPKQTAPAQVQPIARPAQVLTPAPAPLSGWADLHAHPMTNLGFGGKLIHGGVDEQSILPANHSCQPWQHAGTAVEALGDDRPTHGGWDVSFQCGNNLRHDVVIAGLEHFNHALETAGPGRPPTAGLFNLPNLPAFAVWPAWNDITHQKMWWEWIKRARDGGQRVMVALATNNRTLAEALTVGFPDGGPQDDVHSADVQLTEMKNFVARHNDFMEVALDSASLERIVRSNKIAVVLGVEIDNIGNFNSLPAGALNGNVIAGEVQRLYNEGVRYAIPIHVVDNVFGATAIYEPFFAVADLRETDHYWNVACAKPGDGITFQFNTYPADLTWLVNPLKMNFIPQSSPVISPGCPGHRNGGNLSFPPAPGAPGLTNWGVMVVKEMMKRGMIVDIDHMSTDAVDSVLTIAEAVPGGYPIVSGHSGVRGTPGQNAENARSVVQLGRIARLHGMFGLGTGATIAPTWFTSYQAAMAAMGYGSAVYQNGAIGFGTDLNGLVLAPQPPPDHNAITYGNGSFPLAPSPRKPASDPLPIAPPATWNYNTDGVAHYGMLPEFVYDVRRMPPSQPNGISGVQLIDQHFNRSADYFWHMWQRIEAQKVHVN